MPLEKQEKNWRNFTTFPQKALWHVAAYPLLKNSLYKEPIRSYIPSLLPPKNYEGMIPLGRGGKRKIWE